MSAQTADYCRTIESYLCQKNDGHLIRVVGPSFDVVSGWATRGVPLKVALRGIDRYFERYYAKGPRRHPVKIDFCDADVLDVFDEWRRAVGLPQSSADGPAGVEDPQAPGGRRPSLSAHLTRVILRLTNARARGRASADLDSVIDGIARELDSARATPGGIRGAAREALIARLDALDGELLARTRETATDAIRLALEREADQELAPYRETMAPAAFARVRAAAIDRLVREQFDLPTLRYSHA